MTTRRFVVIAQPPSLTSSEYSRQLLRNADTRPSGRFPGDQRLYSARIPISFSTSFSGRSRSPPIIRARKVILAVYSRRSMLRYAPIKVGPHEKAPWLSSRHAVWLCTKGSTESATASVDGGPIRRERNLRHRNDRLWHHLADQCLTFDGEDGPEHGMCVHDCPDLVRQVVEPKVHLDLGGGHHLVGSLQDLALVVDLDQCLRCQVALAHSRWSAQDLVLRKSSRDVAVVGSHHPSVPKVLADIADLRS